jgi:hypothetical protein
MRPVGVRPERGGGDLNERPFAGQENGGMGRSDPDERPPAGQANGGMGRSDRTGGPPTPRTATRPAPRGGEAGHSNLSS